MEYTKKKLTQGAFQGAVQEYETPNGIVSVGFTLDMAYIKEDDQGLFTTADLMHGIKTNGLEVDGEEETVEIANENGVQAKINELGLNDEQIADILARVKDCADLKKPVK